MPLPRPFSVLMFATAIVLVPVTAEATIARAVAFDEKVENATSIVVGRVVSQQSQWNAARDWILTYSTFEIEKTLKGAPERQITVVTPGGTVGNVAQEVVGIPKFRQGDEHVVFIRNSRVGPTVLYFDQGAYRVVKDDRGDRVVQPLVSSAVLVDTQRGTAVAPEHPRRLGDFETTVRQSLRREALQMEMTQQRKREQASIWNQIKRNRTLVVLALIGALLATWQLVKRW